MQRGSGGERRSGNERRGGVGGFRFRCATLAAELRPRRVEPVAGDSSAPASFITRLARTAELAKARPLPAASARAMPHSHVPSCVRPAHSVGAIVRFSFRPS